MELLSRALRDDKMLTIGGLQDIMFFTFLAEGLPLNDVVGWWAPWRYVLGTWTSITQVGLTTLMICSTMVAWVLATRGKSLDIKAQEPVRVRSR